MGSFAHRIIGVNLHSGHRLVTFPHGQFVPVLGTGGTSFVCFHAPRADTLDTVPPPPELTGRA